MRFVYILLTSIVIVMASFTTTTTKLSVKSSAFTEGGMIPKKYSCHGEEVSPPLQVTHVPKEAKSLAMIVHDPDAPMAGGFTHWVIWNMDVSGNIPENFKGASQGLNGGKQHGYKGMCPPSGTHHYHFYIYALDTKLDLEKNTDKAGLEKAMQGHIIGEGELIGLFRKD